MKHHVTDRFEGGLAWASCTCGWESRKLDSYHSFQHTQSAQDGFTHLRQMEALQREQERRQARGEA